MIKEKIRHYSEKKTALCVQNGVISDELFSLYDVKRGLRDENGRGVLTGLTNISLIESVKEENGTRTGIDGELWYRGYNIRSLIRSLGENEFGFERTAYLLLFGEKPVEKQLSEFSDILAESRVLPVNFARDVIMKAPSRDIMNSMTKSILTLSSYDEQLNGDLANNLRQCIRLISVLPMLAVYGYNAYNHYEKMESMYIHRPLPELSTAENFLRMLRPDMQYTMLEAKVLDIVLMLHMEHGGGNNSTFTTRVVTSSGSDTYSTIDASMSSLKGPKHGGANIKVMEMIADVKANVSDITDKEETADYLEKILDGEAFDGKGLIY